jgi:dihydrofolate synthase / folylpolyglutamate synthase
MPQLLPLSLAARRPGRIRPQLELVQQVLDDLGAPQRAFCSVLVVGTNGKGSTAAMLESVLAAHGLVTGLYTSPHLVRVEERIRIAGVPVAQDELQRQLARLDRYPELTFFETLTAAAFLLFAEAGVRYAVLEAGMGGRWDATRAAASDLAGLTNVGSDHREWLGEHWEDRAADKGAALAAARLAVLGTQVAPEVVPHLGAPSALRADQLVTLRGPSGPSTSLAWEGGELKLSVPLAGAHQIHNLQLALALAQGAARLGWIERLSGEAVRRGLGEVRWPGRLSVHRVAGRRLLADCAHNLEGVQALAAHLTASPVLYHLLFSCLRDKPVEAMARLLRPVVGNVAVCELDDERAMPLERLQAAFPEARCAPSPRAALDLLPSPLVAAGSVRLIGDLLAMGTSGPGG